MSSDAQLPAAGAAPAPLRPLTAPAGPVAAGTEVFRHTVRVYWEDTDAGGVVFYANYLKFFERARTEWLRAMGWDQWQLREREDMVFVIADTQVRYLRPARLDDRLALSVRVVDVGRSRLTIAQQAWRLPDEQAGPGAAGSEPPGPLLAEGLIRIACVEASSFRARRFPDHLLSQLPLNPPPEAPAVPA